MGVLKILVIALLLFSPLGQLARIQFGNNISLILNDILAGTVFFIWVIIAIRAKKNLPGQILKPIVIFLSIGFFSLILNLNYLTTQEFFVSFLYLLRWIAYASLYFVVIDFNPKFKTKILNLLIIIGAAFVIIGYLQYFFYSSLRNLYYLGWDEHMYRLFSSFLDPNFAGAFFVLYLLLLIGLIFQHKNKKQLRFTVISLLAIMTIVAIFLTFSRSALITLFVSVFTLLIFLKRKKLIGVFILAFLLFFVISSRSFHIENINLFRIVSSEARVKSSIEAINIIIKQPIFGVGFNSYRYAQIRYGYRDNQGAIESHADAGTDNSFLFILATTGITGFVSYLLIWFNLFKTAFKKRYWLVPVAFASVIGLFVGSLFINSLFYPFLMMWIWLILGLTRENS